ncbi:hypothetical protein ACVWWN_008315 [Mycobacterium sp. URHB0021]
MLVDGVGRARIATLGVCQNHHSWDASGRLRFLAAPTLPTLASHRAAVPDRQVDGFDSRARWSGK